MSKEGHTARSESSGALTELAVWDPKSWQVWLFTDNFLVGKSEGSADTGGSTWGEDTDASETLFRTASRKKKFKKS